MAELADVYREICERSGGRVCNFGRSVPPGSYWVSVPGVLLSIGEAITVFISPGDLLVYSTKEEARKNELRLDQRIFRVEITRVD